MSITSIGLDWSLTSPGICIVKNGKPTFHFLTDKKKFQTKLTENLIGYPYPEYSSDVERYSKIANWAIEIIKSVQGEHIIAIEGFSFGSKGSRLFQIAENAGVLKYVLNQHGYKFAVVPPTVIKKFLSGKGNSKKIVMIESFIQKTGLKLHEEFKSSKIDVKPVDDLVDAYALAVYHMTSVSGDPVSTT